MRVDIVCFTERGARLSKVIGEKLEYDCALASVKEEEGFEHIASLGEWTKDSFQNAGALIFVGACGIAVRSIAPYLQDKMTDPAVIVMDETGRFCIPLVSGHMGGANALAKKLAKAIGATPVITTATDCNGLFAVDSFAKNNGLRLENKEGAKRVSAALLAGEPVGIYSQFPCFAMPKELTVAQKGQLGISISIWENHHPFRETVRLIPKIAHLGVGCKKNTPKETIETLVLGALAQKGISIHSISDVATIDIKANEQGLLAFCAQYQWPLRTFSAAQLEDAKGNFAASGFVKEKTGVDNVCERAAMVAAGEKGAMWITKTIANGATVALAVENWSVDFAK